MVDQEILARDDNRTIFEYLYRDAGNFKSYGSVLLIGEITVKDRAEIEAKMESGEFFIAEQIGVKPLYERLYQFSNGMTDQDHVWHCFQGFKRLDVRDDVVDMKSWGTVNEFKEMFAQITKWDLQLSKHACSNRFVV